jgi:pimeloyl-ACP methyl ester carboxylesterase
MFSPLFRPAPVKDFLYDMTGHVTDPKWYTNWSTDSLDSDTWYRLYWECYYMAYDTTVRPKEQDIYDQVVGIGGDTIPMGILDFDYYRLKPNALTSNIYFNFDTVNNLLSDKAGRPDEPYTTHNIFQAAPLFNMARTSTVTFVVDPQFIFHDPANAMFYNSPYQLWIDFGDGTGKHLFSSGGISYFTAHYMPGLRFGGIETTIEFDGIRKLSRSFLSLGVDPDFPPPTFTYKSGRDRDQEVAVYGGCNMGSAAKVVLYLCRFNPFDFIPKYRQSAGEIYQKMIGVPEIDRLRNFGYEFHIVVWNDSRRDIRENALDVVAIIDNLKRQYGTDHQFIVMGESMGGLIGRYALTFMETSAYADPLTWPTGFARGFRHNTREFISIDVPHQGGNIPLSVQTFYDDALSYVGFMAPISARFLMEKFNLFLDGKSAKQMLIYHVDTKSGWGLYKNYSAHADKNQFFNELASMNPGAPNPGYPEHCKLIALSDGSMNGVRQMRFYNTAPRVPNDRMLDTGFELYARILWFHVPIYGGNLQLLTNPEGNGQIYQQNIGYWGIRLKLFWFGVKIITGYNTLTNRTEYANVLSYCTGPGGYYTEDLEMVVGRSTFNNTWAMSRNKLLNLFAYQTGSDGNGCWNFSAHVGINGFASANTNIWACSDGLHFCLVPLQSALDYGTLGTNSSSVYNIENDSYTQKMASTPFDVISGNVASDVQLRGLMPNMKHLYVKYAYDEGGLMSNNFMYSNCMGNLRGHWLNREIGDDRLYLDGFVAGWNATYESYDYLVVNGFNPAYNYSGGTGTLPGVYSDRQNFSHQPQTPNPPLHSTFICNTTTSIIPPFVHYSITGVPTSEYTLSQTNGVNCCIAYRMAPPENIAEPQSMTIFPNPADGRQTLGINLTLSSEVPVQLTVVDFSGRLVQQVMLTPRSTTGKQSYALPLDPLQLSPGMYLVRVQAGGEEFRQKLIVQ